MSKPQGTKGTEPKKAKSSGKPAEKDGASGVHARGRSPLPSTTRERLDSEPLSQRPDDDVSWDLLEEVEADPADVDEAGKLPRPAPADKPPRPAPAKKPPRPAPAKVPPKLPPAAKPQPTPARKPPKPLRAKLPRPAPAGKPPKPPPAEKAPKPADPKPADPKPADQQSAPAPDAPPQPTEPEQAPSEPTAVAAPSETPPSSNRGPVVYGDEGQRGRTIGRCEMFAELATGGMATIHLGRWIGAGGFNKPVAVKALHPQYARDPEFVAMFLDEARVVARIRHPNVMPTIDLVEEAGELFIVMDYVEGVTLAYLMRKMLARSERIPLDVALRVLTGVLHGLHAAHEAKDERGNPMCVIHRDVSPENVLIGIDGYARLIDFGIATALGRFGKTRDGELKGKLSYLSPEQIIGNRLSRQADVFAAAIVLWQALTNEKLFKATNVAEVANKVLQMDIEPPSHKVPGIPKKLDTIVMRGLERDLQKRWQTAEDMAEAIEAASRLASHRQVGEWVGKIAGPKIEKTAKTIKAMEAAPISAGTDALRRPMSIRPAPSESISAALAVDIKAMRALSDDPLDDFGGPADGNEHPTKPAPGQQAATDDDDAAPDSLEWTGEQEPAEPVVDEESWKGVSEPSGDGAAPVSSRPGLVALEDGREQAIAAATLASHDEPAKTTPVAWLQAAPLRIKLLVGGGGLALFALIVWAFASLGAYVGSSGSPTDAPTTGSSATSAPQPTAAAPQPTPSAVAPTAEPPIDPTTPADGAEDDAEEAPTGSAADHEDAGPASDGTAPAVGKGTVPKAPWAQPTSRTYVPSDL